MPTVLPNSDIETSQKGNGVYVEISLTAAIVSVDDDKPRILIVKPGQGMREKRSALPFGPFVPLEHRTLETGLRSWVKEQTGLELGYVEQLYTFGDRGRHARQGDIGAQVVSIGYLALTRSIEHTELKHGEWQNWYHFFPWEDGRTARPQVLMNEILPRLQSWSARSELPDAPFRALSRRDRFGISFGDEFGWDDEAVLERYELLYEAGLIAEARIDGREASNQWEQLPQFGTSMQFDHRRILATAMSRLRSKIKYRPVIFELMPESFTLFELQRTVEAILGGHLHKQNFRRLVATSGLVEPTGDIKTATGGRPAKAYKFRQRVILERASAGVRVRSGRG